MIFFVVSKLSILLFLVYDTRYFVFWSHVEHNALLFAISLKIDSVLLIFLCTDTITEIL